MNRLLIIFLCGTGCLAMNSYGQSSAQDQERLYQQLRAERLQREAEANASKDPGRCNDARRNLGVLKEAKPVFSYNNKGEKQYVSDDNRQTEIAKATEAVARYCM